MEWEPPRYTQFEAPGPVMGGMRWGDGRPRLVDFCQRTGVVYRKYDTETTMPAPVTHVGPFFVTTPPEQARAGEEYVYQADARDANVNGFSWYLKQAPDGMVVERYTGRITWTPTESCRVDVELWARTHHGRVAKQAWTLSIGKAAPLRVCVPHPRFIEALRRKRLRNACRPRPGFIARGGRRVAASPPPDVAASASNPVAAETPRRHLYGTAPPFRCCWQVARGTVLIACRAAAPPAQPPHGAPALPLRL